MGFLSGLALFAVAFSIGGVMNKLEFGKAYEVETLKKWLNGLALFVGAFSTGGAMNKLEFGKAYEIESLEEWLSVLRKNG